jgi:hypothetical protein
MALLIAFFMVLFVQLSGFEGDLGIMLSGMSKILSFAKIK